MDFSSKFDGRFTLIHEAVAKISINNVALAAYRANTSVISAQVLSDILLAIGSAALVLADITTLHIAEDARPQRNANVLYELGIAHTERLPEENLIFRSDRDALPFDVANIRVNDFDPDYDPSGTVRLLGEKIEASFQAVDVLRLESVRRTVELLDPAAALLLISGVISGKGTLKPVAPPAVLQDAITYYERARPYERLLEIGAIAAKWSKVNLAEIPTEQTIPRQFSKMAEFRVTEFGFAVFRKIAIDIVGGLTPREVEELARRAQAGNANVQGATS